MVDRKKAEEFLQEAKIGHLEVPYKDLCWSFSAELPKFKTTVDLEPLAADVLIGQPRAEMALEIGVNTPGHIYTNSQLNSVLFNLLKKLASEAKMPEVMDVLRVYNFKDPDRPCVIKLGKGQGVVFRNRIEETLLSTLKQRVPAILNEEEANKKWQEIYDNSAREVNELCREVTLETKEFGIVSFHSLSGPDGISIFSKFKKEVGGAIQQVSMSADEYSRLSQEEVALYRKAHGDLVDRVKEVVARGEVLMKEIGARNKGLVASVFEEEIGDLRECYQETHKLIEFLDNLKEYILNRLGMFSREETGQKMPFMMPTAKTDPFLPFSINLSVDNSEVEGVPIVMEGNPTSSRLFGQIIRKGGVFGPANDDHTMIREGALAKACGGILILPVLELFKNGTLDRLFAILSREHLDVGEIPDLFSAFGSNIKPEPLEVDAKVVLVGDMFFFHSLSHHPGFSGNARHLIKTVAEFETDVEQTKESTTQILRLISDFSTGGACLPLEKDAALRVLEYSARDVSHRSRFSLDMTELKRLLVEATYWAKKNDKDCSVLKREHVKKAIDARVFMTSSVRDRLYRLIQEGMVLIEVAGSEVGEINALAVYEIGQSRLAKPSKVTVKTFAGGAGVINVEEKVGQSGSSHKKSFGVLEGFFNERYGKTSALSFVASVVFEQSYNEVDGDSATIAELCGIVSSLSGLSLRQDLAITGSMNQMGEVQPIGGENEKIEGFFDVCCILGAKGPKDIDWREALTGAQGVIVPRRNLGGLVLRDDVMEAIKAGKFHIYAVSHVDEAMEILTGVRAGEVSVNHIDEAMNILNKAKSGETDAVDEAIEILERIKSGDGASRIKGSLDIPTYPEGTINHLVIEGLKKIKAFGSQKKDN